MRRYAHLSSEHLVQYVERFPPLRVVGCKGATIGLGSAELEQSEAANYLKGTGAPGANRTRDLWLRGRQSGRGL